MTSTPRPPTTPETVTAVFGHDLDDATITAILATGATEDDLLEARAWMEGESKDLAAAGFTPTGPVGQIIELFDEDSWPER